MNTETFLDDQDQEVFRLLSNASRDLELEQTGSSLEPEGIPEDIYGDFEMSRPIGLVIQSNGYAGLY